MLTTERQATTKWCPFTRTGYRGIALNRMSDVENTDHENSIKHDTRCVASECMAWRWSHSRPNHGYCGLPAAPVGDRGAGP